MLKNPVREVFALGTRFTKGVLITSKIDFHHRIDMSAPERRKPGSHKNRASSL
jgi:hypothetical protein